MVDSKFPLGSESAGACAQHAFSSALASRYSTAVVTVCVLQTSSVLIAPSRYVVIVHN